MMEYYMKIMQNVITMTATAPCDGLRWVCGYVAKGVVTPPGLEPGSTGVQTCTLTATPKSQAQRYGSQSIYSCVVTLPSPSGNAPCA